MSTTHHANRYTVTIRHIVLAVAAVVVLGLGIYLFVEVRATPAAAQVPGSDGPRKAPPMQAAPPIESPKPDPVAESGAGSQMRVKPIHTPTADDRAKAELNPEPAAELPADAKPSARLDAEMSEANKAYDRGEFDDAKTAAQKVLAKTPGNVRMLRILVSASCIDGDSDTAQKNYLLLPVADREQMKQRCARYGVTFADK
jgi:hypothetical protein